MVQEYKRPASVEEALAMKALEPDAAFLAGGTFLLAGDRREKPRAVIDVGGILPRGVERAGGTLLLGAGATFQDLVESKLVPPPLRAAALSMVNRNVRNAATVAGNVAAGKSCASLLPLFLALGARARVAGQQGERKTLVAEWMVEPRGLLLGVEIELKAGTRAAFGRQARTACDVSVLTIGVAHRVDGGRLLGLRVAMGGLGPHARELPDLAALFEGEALPAKAEIERRSLPAFAPRSDLRGSAEYKALRAASLLADALHEAEEIA